jgi:hypothetical protein
MAMNTAHHGGSPAGDLRSAIFARFAQVGVLVLLQAGLLFLGAGRLDWVWAWVFLGPYVAGVSINALLSCTEPVPKPSPSVAGLAR